MKKINSRVLIAVSSLFISQVNAGVTVLDFDEVNIVHGTIVDDEYSSMGVTIGSLNYNSPNGIVGGGATDVNTTNNIVDIQVAFDTTTTGNQDTDLEYSSTGYAHGYTPLVIEGVTYGNNNHPGNVLILQNADNLGDCSAIKCDTPNDEAGTNAAGYFVFSFNTMVDIISLDTFDVEDNGEFVIQFFRNDVLIASRVEVDAGNTVAMANPINDIINVTNQQRTLLTMQDGAFERQILNIEGINIMRIQLPGSGAIDKLAFRTTEVAAPATLSILSLGFLLLIRRTKK